MAKIPFNARQPDVNTVRRIVFQRLKNEPGWHQLSIDGRDLDPYVEYEGSIDRDALAFRAHDVLWELILERIIAPGLNTSNPNLPWFHQTDYGRKVIEAGESQPYDADGYLARLTQRVGSADATVLAYVRESLSAFRLGVLIASTVMLGVAAERVFILLADSVVNAIADASERSKGERLLKQYQMKPKLDFVHARLRALQDTKPRPQGFPDNTSIAVTAIYDLLRQQRNDLGHPQDQPPTLEREDVFNNLLIFPRYYEIAEQLRTFLTTNTI